jgi:hypothetical protein
LTIIINLYILIIMEHLPVPGPDCMNLVTSMTDNDLFNNQLCIICQEETQSPVTSEVTGRASMKRAAKIRNDVVTKRMKNVLGDDEEDNDNVRFVYHNTNKCYKSYTHSGKLKSIEEKNTIVEVPTTCETPSVGLRKTLRRSVAPCAPPSCDKDQRTLPCVICANVEHKKCRDKFRICEYNSAKKLIDAAKHNQDEVFIRIADRLKDDEEGSVKSLVSADLYCHNLCRQNYMRKYERDIKREDHETSTISNIKHLLFTRALPYIDRMLAKGDCCTMSDIVEFASGLLEHGEVLTSTFRNRDMKQLIISHFGESVTIAPNSRVNESDIFFSSDINAADLAIKLKNQDIMREAGTKLREALMDVDFGLQDSFCDSTDLKTSWERTMMPAFLVTFLGALFKVPNSRLFRSSVEELEDLLQPLDVEENDQVEEDISQQQKPTQEEQHSDQPKQVPQETWVRHHKSTQLHCLFQMLVFNIHNGMKKTPLHLMLGHSIYARDRSRSLLTVLNRIGSCTSYQTIRSARNLLVNYAVKCSEDGETPIPSTFTREDYTMAGMDNSDYADKSSLSGTEGSHYAALVLFQDATVNRPLYKPPVSSTGLNHADPILRTKLFCQEVPPHNKPVVRPTLAADMMLHPENKLSTLLDMQTARSVAVKREFLISLIRLGASVEGPLIWAAVHTLVSSAVVPMMRVGFLPVVPRPITERATVRHCLTNLQSVRRQLSQTSMAVWCDEGVFAIACDIYLHETEQFHDVLLCMGPFHWTRVLLRCQGKLLRGSGPDDALIECAVFGPGVIESVLNGSHYVRALTGMLIVEDLIRSLQWKIFWNHKDKAAYPALAQLQVLQSKLAENQRCPEEFQTIIGEVEELYQDFRDFEKECEAKSELCQFFGVWLQLVAVIKNAVVSDREGNWNLLVATVEDSMPIFAECDCINYLRYGSWYLEQIKVLEFTHPELYRRFSMGQWVVQDRPGWFCAVGGDMKVEQTIQRVSKGPGGHYVVGITRNASAVAEFELLFHEIGSITSLLNSVTSNHPMNHTECHLQHALSTTRQITFNRNVSKLLDFVLQRQNPYSVTVNVPVPLHNLLTKLAVDRKVAARLLKFHENGERLYRSYRRERLVEKIKKISTTISKSKLPRFTDQSQKTPLTIETEKKDISSKDMAEAQRNMDIARERGMDLREILSHNLLSASPLFDGDLPAHTNKSILVGEIEPKLDITKWSQESTVGTHVVVDFMSKMRQMPLSQFPNLGVVIDVIITSALSLSDSIQFIHLVLDSYIEMSLKEGERMRRTDSSTGIDIVGMSRDTPIPQQLDKFWASQENKRNLQLLVRDIVCNRTYGNATIIASSLVHDDEALPAIASGGKEIPELLNWIEEADARLVVHVEWAVREKQCNRIVIVSNDTDTFALLLHYTVYLQTLGLQEMWQQYGTGEKRRMLPLHQAVSQLGASLAKTVIKAHILTGDDCMSKVGTKHAAMACDPVQYLTNFGEKEILLEQDAALAEKYLVRVWAGARSSTTTETFDQLRVENFVSASAGIDALPPTSSEIRGHIQRGAFLVYQACHLLATADERDARMEPLQHGWEEHFGALLPSKFLKPLPQSLLTICKCAGKCDTRRCGCRSAAVLCVIFCHGKTDNSSCTNVECQD